LEFRIGLGLGLGLDECVCIYNFQSLVFLQIELERVWAMEEKGCNLWAFMIHERFCLCDIIYAIPEFLLVCIFGLNITVDDCLFLYGIYAIHEFPLVFIFRLNITVEDSLFL